MASIIWLGAMFPAQKALKDYSLDLKAYCYYWTPYAGIAKGNIIEGVVAKE